MSLDHRKLIIDDTPFCHRCHADFFAYRPGFAHELPLLLFIGGAINAETYHAREKTRPDALADDFLVAREVNKITSAGFLAISSPCGDPERIAHRISDMESLLLKGFLPQVKHEPAQIRAVIGNSIGAHFCTGLVPRLPELRVLVTIAGAAMLESAMHDPRRWAVETRLRTASRTRTTRSASIPSDSRNG